MGSWCCIRFRDLGGNPGSLLRLAQSGQKFHVCCACMHASPCASPSYHTYILKTVAAFGQVAVLQDSRTGQLLGPEYLVQWLKHH